MEKVFERLIYLLIKKYKIEFQNYLKYDKQKGR